LFITGISQTQNTGIKGDSKMAAEWKSTEPDSVQQCVSKSVEEILSEMNTQEKVDSLVLELLSKENQANPNIIDKE